MQELNHSSKKYPHRAAFYKVEDLARDLCGDLCLVPDPENLDSLKREDLTKISHWSNMEPDDVPRLAVLTDSFLRFIDEGEDASVITLWRDGTPIIQQIDGEPCEAAVDAVMDAVTNTKPLLEKWHGLPPLEKEIEIVAYEERLPSGNRPKWLARVARRRLEVRDTDPDEAADIGVADTERAERHAANDNPHPQLVRAQQRYGGRIEGETLVGAIINRVVCSIRVNDGDLWVLTGAGVPFQRLPAFKDPIHASPFKLRDPAGLPAREQQDSRRYDRGQQLEHLFSREAPPRLLRFS